MNKYLPMNQENEKMYIFEKEKGKEHRNKSEQK